MSTTLKTHPKQSANTRTTPCREAVLPTHLMNRVWKFRSAPWVPKVPFWSCAQLAVAYYGLNSELLVFNGYACKIRLVTLAAFRRYDPSITSLVSVLFLGPTGNRSTTLTCCASSKNKPPPASLIQRQARYTQRAGGAEEPREVSCRRRACLL